MKNQTIKLIGVVIMAALMVTGLNAQSRQRYGQESGPHGREFNHRQPNMDRNFSLDLTTEQREEMNTLKVAHYKDMKPLRNKMAELKTREKTLLSEEAVDMDAVYKLIDQQTELTNNIRKLQVKHQIEVKNILTDEQVMKLEMRNNIMKQRRPQHRQVSP